MLRLRSSVLARLPYSPATSPGSSVHRLLASAAPHTSPNPSFAVEDYLVGTCGLTRAQALKASPKLSHLKSSTNSDAVLAFLAGLGLSGTDVAAVVAKDPELLCAKVDKTLASSVAGLAGLGLSTSEVARLVSFAPVCFRCKSVVSNLPYYLSLLGSYDNLFQLIKNNSGILGSSLEKVVKPNVAFLRECGLDARDIAKLCVGASRILGTKPEHVLAMAARAEALGVPCGSGMFRFALQAVAFRTDDTIAVKVEQLKNMFGWSDAVVGSIVCRFPMVLTLSKDMLRSKSEFLVSEAGLEPAYVARRPVMLALSLEGRLRPRYYVLKFLKENGLLKCGRDYYSALMYIEKEFVEKYIHPYKEAAPYLAEDYTRQLAGGKCQLDSALHEPGIG